MAYYEIRVRGILGEAWSDWFAGLEISQEAGPQCAQPVTLISGPVPDQPALHGIFARIMDLNLVIISVQRFDNHPK